MLLITEIRMGAQDFFDSGVFRSIDTAQWLALISKAVMICDVKKKKNINWNDPYLTFSHAEMQHSSTPLGDILKIRTQHRIIKFILYLLPDQALKSIYFF